MGIDKAEPSLRCSGTPKPVTTAWPSARGCRFCFHQDALLPWFLIERKTFERFTSTQLPTMHLNAPNSWYIAKHLAPFDDAFLKHHQALLEQDDVRRFLGDVDGGVPIKPGASEVTARLHV
jgi:hypothetical protein